MPTYHRRHLYRREVVQALIHRAEEMGHRKLPGLYNLTEHDVIEKHKRRHTVPVTKAHAKKSRPGDACGCAIASALTELPEVYAAIVLRRVTYTLEKDVRGKLKIYRYRSPDQAQRLTIRFDQRLPTARAVIDFGPMPPSRFTESQRRYNVQAARRAKKGIRLRDSGPHLTKHSFTRTLLPARLLEPIQPR